jgi:hypothetical protein
MKNFLVFLLFSKLLLSKKLQICTQALMGTFVQLSLPNQYNIFDTKNEIKQFSKNFY